MKATRTRNALIFAAFAVVGVHSAAAAGPLITGFHPAQLYVCGAGGSDIKGIDIEGSNLVAPDTNGRTFDSDVQVLIRHSGGSFSPVRITGWSDTSLSFELNCSRDPETTPGALEFQVIVRGTASNIASLPFLAPPTSPPVITSVSPLHFGIGMTGTRDYLFRVLGRNIGDDTQAYVGGEKAQIGLGYFAEGIVDVWVPNDLRSKSGRYPVELISSNGTSNEMHIELGNPWISSKPNSHVPMPTPTSRPVVMHPDARHHRALVSMDVHMTNLGGHVTLTGSVASIEVKAQLLNAVRSMPGVVDVADQMTIALSGPPTGPPTSPLPHH